MDELKSDLIPLLQFLFPGFIASSIFYWLTAHKKPTPFERVVLALILTSTCLLFTETTMTVLKSLILLVVEIDNQEYSKLLYDYDKHYVLNVKQVLSFIYSIIIGLGLTFIHNQPYFIEKLRGWKFTKNSVYPTNWYEAFYTFKRYLWITTKDGNNYIGWPHIFPDYSDEGHFLLQDVYYYKNSDSTFHKMDNFEYFLLNVKDVERVMFINNEEVTKINNHDGK